MNKLIYSKNYSTPSGQKRQVNVYEDFLGGYRVVKLHIPKKKSSIIYGSYDSYFSNKAKALKKAKSFVKKK